MTEADMDEACGNLREGGCRSVHIGGGEPFLDFDGLLALINTCKHHGISVEYVETNAYWATSSAETAQRLQSLSKAGANTLCISIDPFHAEFIPYSMPLKLAEACWKAGFGYFLWQEQLVPIMSGADPNKTHDRGTLEKVIGNDYILDTARLYGLKLGGRAINIESEYTPSRPLEDILDDSPCRNLLSVGHFHVDMYNRFIPPGCTGIAVPFKEMLKGLEPGRYPAFEALYSGGIKSLIALASKEHGFVPEPGYPSRCAVCFHIRRFLSKKDGFPELDAEHYESSMDVS